MNAETEKMLIKQEEEGRNAPMLIYGNNEDTEWKNEVGATLFYRENPLLFLKRRAGRLT